MLKEEAWTDFVYSLNWLQNHENRSEKMLAEELGISVACLNKIKNGELPSKLNSEVIYDMIDFLYFNHDNHRINYKNKLYRCRKAVRYSGRWRSVCGPSVLHTRHKLK